MKKRINLFIKKRKNSIEPFVTDRINFYSTLMGILLFVIFLVFIFLQIRVQAQKNSLIKEKQDLYSFILSNKEEVAKMNLYSHKNAQLTSFLKDDAQFLPYYNLLKDAIIKNEDPSQDPVLDYMSIDKDKNTDFTVRFLEYQPAYVFLKVMESQTFLDNFIELKLVGFNLNDVANSVADKKGYELQFKGKFKPIDGTTNQ